MMQREYLSDLRAGKSLLNNISKTQIIRPGTDDFKSINTKAFCSEKTPWTNYTDGNMKKNTGNV